MATSSIITQVSQGDDEQLNADDRGRVTCPYVCGVHRESCVGDLQINSNENISRQKGKTSMGRSGNRKAEIEPVDQGRENQSWTGDDAARRTRWDKNISIRRGVFVIYKHRRRKVGLSIVKRSSLSTISAPEVGERCEHRAVAVKEIRKYHVNEILVTVPPLPATDDSHPYSNRTRMQCRWSRE